MEFVITSFNFTTFETKHRAGTEVGCKVLPLTKLTPLVKSPVLFSFRGLRLDRSPSAKMPKMFLKSPVASTHQIHQPLRHA